jgi:DNA helicase-2/ATP-dependent DNA helicase PcrA
VRGVDVIESLKKRKIDYVEYLASTSSTRAAAGALGNVAAYLADPSSTQKLVNAYQVWRRAWRDDNSLRELVISLKQPTSDEEIIKSVNELQFMKQQAAGLLRKCNKVESYLAPSSGRDWLEIECPTLLGPEENSAVINELGQFRDIIRRWQGSTLLPIDQMILTLAQDLFTETVDLALAHKLALVLRQAADDHPDWRLQELTAELGVVAKNERRFLGFSADDSGFDPGRYRGKVVVSTMHKAKGLEWDRVYLMSVNNYDFPSRMQNDQYISEKWFARQGLNLEAEALAQLRNALSSDEFEWQLEGEATQRARTDYVRERLRLIFVAITRAKSELIITWNSGRNGDQTQSIPFAALQAWWQSQQGN